MVYVSAITLVELALLFRAGTSRIRSGPEVILQALESEDAFQILPLTTQIAREIPTVLPALKDPMDATIAATARVHGLRLVTSDQRILDSNVVSTVG
jgi:PIN domain nuclease of toxin-antitoxin system